MKYIVSIEVISHAQVEIEADTMDEAESKVLDMAYNSEIALSPSVVKILNVDTPAQNE